MDRERSSAPAQLSLLIVEDDAQVRRMLKRLMSRRFDAVFEANSVEMAESVLSKHLITHLLLDHHLGDAAPKATPLVSSWRSRYPAISRIVLLTGAAMETLEVPPAVDACISKGDDPLLIQEALGR